MIKILLPILLLITGAKTSCALGCRKCNSSNECLFCDIIQGFVLQASACVKIEIEHCFEMTADGKCKICEPGFFPAFLNEVCLVVTKHIDNCKFYSNESVCSVCEPGYNISNTKCVLVPTEITNCTAYNSKNRCSECDSGYIPTTDGLSCVSDPLKSNCAIYGNLVCNRCRADHIMNYNNYFDFYYRITNTNLNGTFIDIMARRSKHKRYNDVLGPCQPIELQNCEEIKSFNTCARCIAGYYVDSEYKCRPNPYPVIPNCKTYTANDVCDSCEDGYHLSTTTKCEANTVIENCEGYSTIETVTTCLYCRDGYYLAGNTCIPREKSLSIPNCVIQANDQDRCNYCDLGYVIGYGGLFCKNEVLNCNEYNPQTGTDELPVVCTKCRDGFYLNTEDNTCIEGSIPNCSIYDKTSNICVKCETEYYQSENTCLKHEEISACYDYAQFEAYTCTLCANDHFLIRSSRVCRPTIGISYCEEYISFDQCEKCQDRYYLSNNQCFEINPGEHCLQKNGLGNCVKCEPEYLLTGNACRTALHFQRDHCVIYDQSGTNNFFQCNSCDYNYYPFDYTGLNTCISVKSLSGGGIPHCTKHIRDADDSYKCQMCDSEFVVSSDKKYCIPFCDRNETLVITKISPEDDHTSYMTVHQFSSNACYPSVDSLAHCDVATSYAPDSIGCLKCKSYAVTSYSNANDGLFTLFNANDWSAAQTPSNISVSYLFLMCSNPNNPILYPGNTRRNTNCEYYTAVGDRYLCKKCVYGKTGPMVNIDISGNNHTYIDCNYEVAGCDTSVHGRYGGLHFDTKSIKNFLINPLFEFSCFKCNSSYHIPVIHTRDKNDDIDKERLAPYGLSNGDTAPISAADLSGHHTVCRSITAEGLKIPDGKFIANWIENCGLAWYNTELIKDFTSPHSNTASIKCLECKPGYRKVVNNNGFVISCDKIENCNTMHTEGWFNSCSECALTYTYRFDTLTRMTNFDFCLPNTQDNNCMVMSQTDLRSLDYLITHPSKYCRHCKKGFSFNKDGYCERINVPKCITNNFIDMRNIKFDTTVNGGINYNYLAEYLAPRGIGCTKCESDFLGLSLSNESENLGCTYSSYIALRKFNISTAYVPNCRFYSGLNGVAQCGGCEVGYILSSNQQKCVLETGYPRCRYVNVDIGQCDECVEDYTLVNSICQLKSIVNCRQYNSNNPKFIQCEVCEDTYRLNNQFKCEKGPVIGCAQYDNNGNCSYCLEFNVGVYKNGFIEVCLPIKEDLNCRYADGNKLTSLNQYYCNECVPGYSFDDNISEVEKTFCLKGINVPNCITFSDKNSLTSAEFDCVYCKMGYYANGRQCVKRTDIDNCYIYSTDEDTCAYCNTGYFKSSDGKKCHPNPSGVTNCLEYSDAVTCTKCKSYMNLQSNLCNQLATSLYQESCEFYRNSVECIGCKAPYLFVGNNTQCQLMVAQNCYTAKSITECESCKQGFVLQTNPKTSSLDCVEYRKRNCTLVDKKSPYDCLQCVPEYYIKTGNCAPVAKIIPGCRVYPTDSQCSECQTDHILSADALSCKPINSLDYFVFNGCEVLQYTETLKCLACDLGYYFDLEECVPCPNSVIDGGCLACDYVDNKTCLMCQKDYYQNNDGRCVSAAMDSGNSFDSLLSTSRLMLIGLISAFMVN